MAPRIVLLPFLLLISQTCLGSTIIGNLNEVLQILQEDYLHVIYYEDVDFGFALEVPIVLTNADWHQVVSDPSSFEDFQLTQWYQSWNIGQRLHPRQIIRTMRQLHNILISCEPNKQRPNG